MIEREGRQRTRLSGTNLAPPSDPKSAPTRPLIMVEHRSLKTLPQAYATHSERPRLRAKPLARPFRHARHAPSPAQSSPPQTAQTLPAFAIAKR